MNTLPGPGLGWRHEVAGLVLSRPDLGFVEVLAENVPSTEPIPLALEEVRRRGLPIVPHGVTLSLGGAERPDPARLAHLARLAERLGAPMVSEHVAFVRAGGIEAGHLLPVPRTRDCLDVLVENVRIAQDALPVPLALENIAAAVRWPEPQLDEADFLAELLERTGARLLLDLANLYANCRNTGADPLRFLDRVPLERLAYVHVAGGTERPDGFYADTHSHRVPAAVLDLVRELRSRCDTEPAVMLERDRNYPRDDELRAELDAIAAASAAVRSDHG